ncbi:MAG: CpsD/CapB family tyrosine-protein kinase [Cellvibrionaceae bacterium]
MSKLETAFSKAMKEQNKQPGNADQHKADAATNSSNDIAKVSGTQATISPRNQISRMQQEFTFTEDQLADRRLIYPSMKDEKLLNIYRNIRTKLIAKAGSKNFTTLVTSVVPAGGTSLIAANIANVFAFDEGKTSLLIDANVRSPALAEIFQLESEAGIVDYLESDDMPLDKILYPTGVSRLRLIPVGSQRENATEYFSSERMGQFFNEVVERYAERYPIIDAPSLSDSADTRILIDKCDLVVLVIPYGQCTTQEIKTAARTIGQSKLAGVVLNQF